jgi:hypothetical protein
MYFGSALRSRLDPIEFLLIPLDTPSDAANVDHFQFTQTRRDSRLKNFADEDDRCSLIIIKWMGPDILLSCMKTGA